MLQIKNLSVSYGAIEAVKNISLTVNDGEIVSLIGANGAGKTTTLHTITGLTPAVSGEVLFNGVDLLKTPNNKIVTLGMAHIPEGRHVFTRMSVQENLEMGAFSLKDRSHMADDLAMVFDMFPRLKERRNQKAGTLSGGEQQMLAMGRADEPPEHDSDGRAVDGSVSETRQRDLRHYSQAARSGHYRTAGRTEREYGPVDRRSCVCARNRAHHHGRRRQGADGQRAGAQGVSGRIRSVSTQLKNPALQWWGQQAEKGGVMSEIRAISDESLAQAVEIVRDGGLIVIPTDTVYGVACDPRNIEAIRKVFAAKQRPKYKSLQVLLPSIESMEKLHLDLPVPLNRLSAMFMPGAFSPIAVADDDCTLATVRTDPATGKVTQGVRIPNSAAALRVLRATGPLAATSANRSGDESAQTVDEAVQALGDAVDLYLDGGATPGHVASTVVAADPHGRDGIAILREGVIHEPVIRKALTLNGGALGV